MRLLKLLAFSAVAAAGVRAYRRYQDRRGARAATAAAEPFSTDRLEGDTPAASPEPAAAAAAGPDGERGDPLTRPSWLDPADAG